MGRLCNGICFCSKAYYSTSAVIHKEWYHICHQSFSFLRQDSFVFSKNQKINTKQLAVNKGCGTGT
jgi:hypothetical protein